MKLPKYSPDQWVVYQTGEDSMRFGQIKGGDAFLEDGKIQWLYNLLPNRQGHPIVSVSEDNIVAIHTDKGWARQGDAKSLEEAGISF